jgi:hypothetical protein
MKIPFFTGYTNICSRNTFNHKLIIMKKICFLFFLIPFTQVTFAQKEKIDIISYTPPKGWKKEVKNSVISYTIVNKQKKTWCQLGVFSSTASKGSIAQDFENEWQELVVKQYKTTDAPQVTDIPEAEGWKIKSGGAKFIFNKADALAMLTTFSGYGRALSIVASTNTQDYITDIQNLIASIELSKPDTTVTVVNNTPLKNTATPATKGSFAFTTTNFDDGWISTVQEDWVQVTKGSIKILIHYPNAKADAYNSVLKDGDYNAWNTLVAPRYSNMSNFEWKSIQSWQSITFVEADATETATGKKVHIVLFKEHYSNGSGAYLEFITDTKAGYENEFGAYRQESYGWEKTANMQFRNKFAVAASDLNGTWTNNFTGMTQYVNAYTGASAGADTHASSQKFIFGENSTYKWDIAVANGFVGNIKFQSAKSNGKYTMPGAWQIHFSEMEGKPKTYDAYFSCVKGSRLLWLSDVTYPGYSAYGKAN